MSDGIHEVFPLTIRVFAEVTSDIVSAPEKKREIIETLGRISGVTVVFEETPYSDRSFGRYTILDESVDELDFGTSELMSTKVSNALIRNGITRLRDVLVVGKDHVRDISGLGEGSLRAIEHTITKMFDTDYVWLDKPNVDDIVAISTSVGEVTGLAIGALPYYTELEDGLRIRRYPSVQDILMMTTDALAEAYGLREYNHTSNKTFVNKNYDIARYLKNRAISFASAFATAKTKHSDEVR